MSLSRFYETCFRLLELTRFFSTDVGGSLTAAAVELK